MNVLVYLVPMALLLGLAGLIAFLWSVSSGQYDDLEGASFRALDDSDLEPPTRRRAGRTGTRLPGRDWQRRDPS